jgi:hypothetical protein
MRSAWMALPRSHKSPDELLRVSVSSLRHSLISTTQIILSALPPRGLVFHILHAHARGQWPMRIYLSVSHTAETINSPLCVMSFFFRKRRNTEKIHKYSRVVRKFNKKQRKTGPGCWLLETNGPEEVCGWALSLVSLFLIRLLSRWRGERTKFII